MAKRAHQIWVVVRRGEIDVHRLVRLLSKENRVERKGARGEGRLLTAFAESSEEMSMVVGSKESTKFLGGGPSAKGAQRNPGTDSAALSGFLVSWGVPSVRMSHDSAHVGSEGSCQVDWSGRSGQGLQATWSLRSVGDGDVLGAE